jgi:hypothetical protein
MSQETLKVTVTFPLEVPVLYDDAGRCRSIMDHIVPYIDWITLLMAYGWCPLPDDCEMDLKRAPKDHEIEMYHRMTSEEMGERLAESERRAEEHRIEYEKKQDEECRELYGCSWSDFNALSYKEKNVMRDKFKDKECLKFFGCSWANYRALNWKEQEELRKKHGVCWSGVRFTQGVLRNVVDWKREGF